MALSRQARKLLHMKGNQPKVGKGSPRSSDGKDGDTQIRRVAGKGIVQYVKMEGKWNKLSTTT